MQSNKIQALDARTFPQIWKDFEEDPRRTKLLKKLAEAFGVTTMAVYKWGNGQSVPRYYAVKSKVSSITNRTLKIKTSPETLFPTL